MNQQAEVAYEEESIIAGGRSCSDGRDAYAGACYGSVRRTAGQAGQFIQL